MLPDRHDARSDVLAPWIVGALLAAPVLITRYPPMGDLPFHEAMVAILGHLKDPAFAPTGLYGSNLGPPNQLFHLLAWLLSRVFATDTACKLVVAAVILATPVTAARLAQHLGASRWTALVVAPLAIGWTFRWGLAANMLGFALLLGALPSLDRLSEAPSIRRAAQAVVFTVLLYFAHESAMVIYGLAGFIFLARAPLRLRSLALAVSPILACIALALFFELHAESVKAPSIRTVHPTFQPIGEKLTSLPGAAFSAQALSLPLFCLMLAAFVAFAWPRFRGMRLPKLGAPRAVVAQYRFELVAFACFVAYLAMPLAMGGATLIYHRFLPAALALAVIGGAARGLDRQGPSEAFARMFAFVLPIAALGAITPSFLNANTSYRDLDVVLAQIKDDSAVAQLDLTPKPPGLANIVGAGARALAVHGGRMLFSYTDGALMSPVLMPMEHRWNEPALRMTSNPYAFCPSHDLTRFRYVLVRNTEPNVTDLITRAFLPEGKLIAHAGVWMLFESTLETASLMAPDAPFPSPPPESLLDRIRKLLPPPGPKVDDDEE